MIHTLKLLLPALVPSWNFFDVIAASPRIEYALLPSPDAAAGEWLAFRPRPERVPLPIMLARLLWNARWNETLFVVSCAERLLAEPTEHSQNEIFRRIAADLGDELDAARLNLAPLKLEEAWLRFRITLVSEHEDAIVREIAFISDPRRVATLSTQ